MRLEGLLAAFLMAALAGACGCSQDLSVDGKTLAEWVNLLKHEEWSTQVEAQEKITRMGPRAVPYLSKMVWAKDPALRKGTIVTLGKMGKVAAESLPTLLKRIKVEQVAPIRAQILRTLVFIDPRATGVPEELEKRLRDQEEEVRAAAREGLDALAPQEPDSAQTGTGKQPKEEQTLLLRQEVAAIESMQGTYFGLVAEVVRENRRAAVVWAAIRQGQIQDGDPVAFVFEPGSAGGWKLVGERIDLSAGKGADKLSAALGGADRQTVIRDCGVERGRLPSFLEEKGREFQQALDGGDAAGAVRAYQELTRAFSFRLAAYDGLVPELLRSRALFDPPWKFDPGQGQEGAVLVEMRVAGQSTRGELRLGSCGGGAIISEIKQRK